MMVLHHCISARSFRPLWLLEELGLPYRLVVHPFPPRVRVPEFRDINPLGTIPVFFDGALRMTESVAICQYIVARHAPGTLEVSVDEEDFGVYLNWLHFGEATLTFPQTLVLRYEQFEPPERRLPRVAEDYRRWFLSRLRAVDAAVRQSAFLCAGRLTLADISVGYALLLARQIGLEHAMSDAVLGYGRRLRERPAFRRALQAEVEAAEAQGVSPQPAATLVLD